MKYFAAALLLANVSAASVQDCQLSLDQKLPYSYNSGCGFCDWKQYCSSHDYCSTCCTANGELKTNTHQNCRARKTDDDAAPLAASNVLQVQQFVAGLLKGLVQDNALDKVQVCLKDATSLQLQLMEAIGDFKKKDLADVIKGATVVGKMLEGIEVDLADCEGMESDIKRIQVWAEIFRNPKELASTMFANTIKHIMPIHNDIGKVEQDVTSQNFEDMGEAVADILVQQLGKVPELNEKKAISPQLAEALAITKGVLLGAVKAEGLDNIETCITGVPIILNDVEIAIKDFKANNAGSTLDGLKHLAVAVAEMKDEVEACQGVSGDWAKLTKMVAIFDSPASFAYHVGKDLVVNGEDIFDEVADSITQYDNQQYEAFGEDIGTALAKLILGDAQAIQQELIDHRATQDLNLY